MMDEDPAALEDVSGVAARFDERAANYDDSSMHHALAAAVAAFVGLEGVRTVLDVATGTGLLLRSLPENPDRRLIGADISAGMLAQAHAHLPAAELMQVTPGEPLPLPDASADLITCVTGLHLMPVPEDALRDWRRLLAPGGHIVVATFRADRRTPGHGHNPNRVASIGTPDALAAVAAHAGLAVGRLETWTHQGSGDTCMLAELLPID